MSGPTPAKAELGPPPRWLKCPRKGQPVGGKLVPFKTPLCDLYDDQIPEMYRFPVSMVFATISSQRCKLGLWIDLTNTDRFYGKDEVEELGGKYTKLNCKGHGECPSATVTEAFLQICRNHVKDQPNDLIGIHCTHGFNRTGFLICAYLVTELDWSIEAAVHAFSQSRPPGIYKQEYITELFRRYGEVEDAPTAPDLPGWCDESEPILDDNEAESEHCRPSTSTGQIKKIPEFEPVIEGVTAVLDIAERRRLQNKITKMCDYKANRFPGSQPISMDMENIALLQGKEYFVSWKADGTRYLMLIEDEGKIFMFDRDNNPFAVSNLRFPHRKETRSQSRHLKDTLVDGEMVLDKINGKDIPRFLLYDIVRFEGQEVGKCDLRKRFQCINHEIISSRKHATEDGRIRRDLEPFSVRLKVFKPAHEGVPEYLNPDFAKNLPHEIDGLVFQPVPDPYISGRCQAVLKWKPHELNSVDFKLQVVREQREGMLAEWVGYLYVLGMPQAFGKIKVNKALKEFDMKIIECKFDGGNWIFMRERKDKSFPNAYATAYGVCQSITNPVTKEFLLDFVKTKAFRLPSAKRPAAPDPSATPAHVPNNLPSLPVASAAPAPKKLALNAVPEDGPVPPSSSDTTLMPPPAFLPPSAKT